MRSESKNVLLVNADGAIGDTQAAGATDGKAVIELRNALRYDAMTVGNHEPAFTQFDVVAANGIDSQT